MTTLVHFANTYGRIEEYPEAAVLRYARSEVPYGSPEAIERSVAETARLLDRLGRDSHALLVDLRETPGSNDPGFEEAMSRARKVLLAGFPRVAVLVRTATGLLQMQRHAREDGGSMHVFQDEAEALAFLGAWRASPAG